MKLSIFTLILLSSFYTQAVKIPTGQSFKSAIDGKNWTIIQSKQSSQGITHQICVPSAGPERIPFVIQAIALAGCCPRRINRFIAMYKEQPKNTFFDQEEKTLYSFFPHLTLPKDSDPE